jgi:carotenoid cleavage dioxygenase-like enzyme
MAAGFLTGFESQLQELKDEILPVTGHFPGWLSGILLRDGPGKFEVGTEQYRHWFDGLALLHRFQISEGAVVYTNRFLRSKSYRNALENGKISNPEFATNPRQSFFSRFSTVFNPPEVDNASVNITRMDGSYVAMTETPRPVKFDPASLRTEGNFYFDDEIKMQATTAHPHLDPTNRNLVNFGVVYSATSLYQVYSMKPGSVSRHLIGSLKVKEPSYMHSFAITENYVILVEYPLLLNPLGLLLSGKPYIENAKWKPQNGTRFLVMHKKDGSMMGAFQSDAFFSFHHINAYEEQDAIILDTAAYSDATVIQKFYLDSFRGPGGGVMPEVRLRRYTLRKGKSHADYETSGSESIELPRINYGQHNGKSYNYAYGISIRRDKPDDFFNQLVKFKLPEGSSKIWYEEGCYPGEPVFVARPGGEEEDNGVVLSVVLDSKTGKSFLLALDGQTFEETGRAEVPQHIPFGFHGIFVPAISA